MRKWIFLLFAGGIFPSVWGQNLAEWPLDNLTGENPVNIASGLSATVFQRGNGISALQFNAGGAGARGWSEGSEISSQDYFEVCLIPASGRTMEVTGIEFSESRTGTGPRVYQLWYSTDGFATATRLDSVGIPDNPHERTHNLTGLQIGGCNAVPVCFRWYAYQSENSNGFWRLREVDFNGAISAACTPPALAGSLSVVNIGLHTMDLHVGPGAGDGCLVVMRKGQAVASKPCNGEVYTGFPDFGTGGELSNGAYVVYAGPWNANFTAGNLEEGARYYFTLFPYHSTNYCYNLGGPPLLDVVMLCQNPGEITGEMAFAADGKLNLLWTPPDCYDEVLVVASANPVTGAPDGNGSQYLPNLAFGAGSDPTGDFAPGEYPVYRGNGNALTITGLTNETPCFVKVFARRNTNWSDGVEWSATPFDGCPDLGGHDVVFINEIHYENNGEDVDEGVEIAGPANYSLEGYELHFYETIAPNEGQFYLALPLYDRIDDEGNGSGALWFPVPGMADGSGGIVLYNTISQTIVQFLGYRNSFTAIDGVAAGMTSTLLTDPNGGGIFESAAFPAGTSIQMQGTGACPLELYWTMMQPMSPGGLNDNQSVLPIVLLEFTARLYEDRVLLYWQTASEQNNDYMAVERSADGRTFVEIGRVRGAGNSDQPLSYSLWDDSPHKGINYYRLRQVDFDGKTSYSGVVSVWLAGQPGQLSLAPNPAKDQLQILGLDGKTVTRLEVVNAGGQVMNIPWNNAASFESLNIGDLSPGLYFIRLADDSGWFYTGRFVRTRE